MIATETIEIRKPTRAIVLFGPPTDTSGFKAGEYFSAVLDPNCLSPGGDYLRFDQTFQNTEIHGWQRVEALTVCEVLGEVPIPEPKPEGYQVDENAVIRIRAIVRSNGELDAS